MRLTEILYTFELRTDAEVTVQFIRENEFWEAEIDATGIGGKYHYIDADPAIEPSEAAARSLIEKHHGQRT